MIKTLAIETSCDDTSLAVVAYDEGNFVVEKLVSFAQIDIHAPYGGVVPELANRSHTDKIIRLLEELGGNKLRDEIDFISVTAYPGLPGALVVGITTATMLGKMRDKTVVEVNHIMGHVFSILPDRNLNELHTPYICMTVSGGHNDIYLVESWKLKIERFGDNVMKEEASESEQFVPQAESISADGGVADEARTYKLRTPDDSNWVASWPKDLRHKRNHLALHETIHIGKYAVTKIGQTLDDAAGEAFDKVSRMLGGPNPWGARIGELAKKWTQDPRVKLNASFLSADEFLFSFSWLKSQVHYLLQTFEEEWVVLDEQLKANIAYMFQEEVAHVLAKKIVHAAQKYEAKTISLVGGVSASVRIRERISQLLEKNSQTSIPFLTPAKFVYCTDNAAMIGAAGLVMNIK